HRALSEHKTLSISWTHYPYGIVIEDLQFTLAGNEEITLRHLSFREQQ
ncbi:hypothetical protein QJN82_22295, partial [Escherichia coli]